MPSARESRAALDGLAFAERLGLEPWQLARAVRERLVPDKDRSRGWSAALVDDIAARVPPVRELVGSVPDMGAFNAARHFSDRFGIDVAPDTVHELGRLGHLTIVDWHKTYPVYAGRSVEAFTGRADHTILDKAAADGKLLTSDDAAAHLQVRRTDFDHLVRAGLVSPAWYGHSGYGRRSDGPTVALYRIAALNALAGRTDIDWAAVRSTPAGRRSPLAKLPTAPKVTP